MTHYINIDDLNKFADVIRAGDEVLLTGTVFTARDAAHKRICELLDQKEKLPFELAGSVIYYAGPTEARPGTVIGSCGPTTGSRMDRVTPRLLDLGLTAVIAKGERSSEVRKSFLRNKSLYFCAVGGAGALASKAIKSCKVIAFSELGCESVKQLWVENLPVFCAYDISGGSIFANDR